MTKKAWDSDWVHFSKRARRGIVVLLILFVAVAVTPRIYYNYFYTPPHYDVKVRSIALAERSIDSIDTKVEIASKYTEPSEMFNPNKYSLKQWMDVGLSEKQAASILKYLNSGAELKVKADLKRLYVVDDELYNILLPKLDLPDSLPTPNYAEQQKPYKKYIEKSTSKKVEKTEAEGEKEAIKPISINTASDWDLKKIPGIGPYFAKEIIKTRDSYGGIVSYDQLFDIYLMDEEKIESIKPYLILDKSEVRKLNLNSASEKELRDHPLISFDMAKSIVFFRENHRPYKRIDEIILSPYIDGEKFKALKPFIKVE
ncbi:ComEA family DNA-binding protein [Brumimicrobium oceani]|uniref:Competence protein ComEA n=1 Tax=Brumimicrobium oceani TaxID=2100725 RepID=A0A2U2XDL7_9FLAO|nr:helix-hairpin-helix domain-containing protein [Brumimicrobium oceani]PWH85899.1 hypothetical protein DIT68_07355 [Brumimicrobium oceani]